MSNYDKLALNSRPTLYLSAPETTDKSGTSNFALGTNNLSPIGQPIIFGGTTSFYMTDATTVAITGNPLFFNDTASFECVVVADRPNDITPLLIDDADQNAVLLTPEGVMLKLYFDNLLSTYSKTAMVPIKNWSTKLYIVVTITETQATLAVNGVYATLSYSDTIIDSTNIEIGGGTDYHYLMDGIGFYNKTIRSKQRLIDDPNSGYSTYAALRHGGRTTKFEGYIPGYKQTFTLNDFLYEEDLYTLIYQVAHTGEGLDYITVKCNDENVVIAYDIDLDTTGEFTEYLMLNDIDDKIIRLMVTDTDVDNDFAVTIEAIENADVLYETPADLVLDGMALYSSPAQSIVNYPDGVKLDAATYTGTWIYGDGFENVPQTVEIVFRPVASENDTYVFYSADGEASFGTTGSIGSNFTAYLNGNVVTDLSDIKYNQWNHLVLVDATAAATEFYLNSATGAGATESISYMLLTGYQGSLTADDAAILYQILIGSDVIVVEEAALVVNEGVFANGTAFNAYSYAWAIVGAGGS